MRLVGAALATVFGLLAALHVFWACGGRRGAAAAIPELDGRPRSRDTWLYSPLSLLLGTGALWLGWR
jgi:hypothetical protein